MVLVTVMLLKRAGPLPPFAGCGVSTMGRCRFRLVAELLDARGELTKLTAASTTPTFAGWLILRQSRVIKLAGAYAAITWGNFTKPKEMHLRRRLATPSAHVTQPRDRTKEYFSGARHTRRTAKIPARQSSARGGGRHRTPVECSRE